jgi:hypothetical protein
VDGSPPTSGRQLEDEEMRKSAWWSVLICGIGAVGMLGYVLVKDFRHTSEMTIIPGTGVTMALPDGVSISPLGTIFANDNHDVFVGVIVGSDSTDLSGKTANRAIFPDQVEFRSSTISGSLYKRVRAKSGGSWDGWWLHVARGDRSLDIVISYSGSKPEEFLELKKYLSTVSWSDQMVDPELAFGLRLNVPGLQLVSGVGGLMYTQNRKVPQSARYMLVTSTPYSLKGDMSKFHKLCEKSALAITHGQPISVRYETKNQIAVCDAWTGMTANGDDYFAALMLQNGAFAQVVGHGDPEIFQHALLDARVIPRDTR